MSKPKKFAGKNIFPVVLLMEHEGFDKIVEILMDDDSWEPMDVIDKSGFVAVPCIVANNGLAVLFRFKDVTRYEVEPDEFSDLVPSNWSLSWVMKPHPLQDKAKILHKRVEIR